MSFVPLAVERFITIAFPYRHRSILTNRRAILMGMAVWIVSVILATVAVIVVQIEILAPFGGFYPVKNRGILVLIGLFPRLFSITLITSTNIYLHGQIAKSKRKLMENQKTASEDDSQRLLQGRLHKFRAQITTMMSLQMLGGINGLISIIPILYALMFLTLASKSITFVQQLFIDPLQWGIFLSHSYIFGVYTKRIRLKLFGYSFKQYLPASYFSHRSKVIILNKNTRPVAS